MPEPKALANNTNPMSANELRKAFLDFFIERDHKIVPSASLIPHDPSVMFTIAGMIPFKRYFTGEEVAPYKRATSVQKCIRTVDIDIVGTTARHCTFFEMLGNFSFGDYFKKDAIAFAWDFVTKVLKLQKDKLWITVHESDDDAIEIWANDIHVDRDRIQKMGEDNFWKMGETGPCGPCSEIYYDKGPEFGEDGGPKFGGSERFVEIWNLVFMQYERSQDGTLNPLPNPCIDTGAGLERILTIVQGVSSLFQTDLMAPLIAAGEEIVGKKYGEDLSTDVTLAIMADHARAMTFLISDGVFPSNEGRGYVLRRLVRRVVRRAWMLGIDYHVTPILAKKAISTLSSAYPRLLRDEEFIEKVLAKEESSFRETLKSGSTILDEAIESAKNGKLSGDIAFKLHDTFGFPIELTQEIASEKGLEVDLESYNKEMDTQKQRARNASKNLSNEVSENEFEKLKTIFDTLGKTEFLGYDTTKSDARVLDVIQAGDGATVILDQTPFYSEGGGQVGDQGYIYSPDSKLKVIDTQTSPLGVTRHICEIKNGHLTPGDQVVAEVDSIRRDATRRNHTGTHLLHWALRKVLGDHVRQQGSLVTPDRLRFDFSHFGPLTSMEINEVETLIAGEVLSDGVVATTVEDRHVAEEKGAIAFFGDRYGESVRVVQAGSESVELCGGTHVSRLGMIGDLVIVAESSIGSNTRRIEALTGLSARDFQRRQSERLHEVATRLKSSPEEVIEALERQISHQKHLEDELKKLGDHKISA
ncbi:MAG: alanine--tRNA ligase, partial [Acidimicrobiales bacterium]|nr:alanine--tRNA ligase [Acidimicrobiales bacterium]